MKRAISTLFLLTAGGLGAQVTVTPVFSGSAQTQISYSWNQTWPPSLIEPQSVVEGGLDLEAGDFRGEGLGGLTFTANRPSWKLSQGWASWGEERFLSLKAGWWPEPTGPALVHSLVPTFTTVSGTAFLASSGTAQPVSPAKGRLALTWEEFALSVEMAEGAQPLDLPDAGSIWFPHKDIPTQFEIASWATYRLSQISVLPPTKDLDLGPLDRWRVEARWSALWGDATLGAYRGADPQVIFPYQMTFPDTAVYGISLHAQRNLVRMGWMTLEVPIGAGKFWTEQRFTQGRLRVEGDLKSIENGVFSQNVSNSNAWEGVFGASYSVSQGAWGTLRVWTEGNRYRDLDDPNRAAPEFSEGWEGGLSWDEARGLANLSIQGGTPWTLAQGWVWARATWSGWESKTLWVGAPLFWGSPDTSWGQFSNTKVLEVGTTYHW